MTNEQIVEYQERRKAANRVYAVAIKEGHEESVHALFTDELYRDNYFAKLADWEARFVEVGRRRFVRRSYPVDCERLEDIGS